MLTDQKLGCSSGQHYKQVSIFPRLLVWPSKKSFFSWLGCWLKESMERASFLKWDTFLFHWAQTYLLRFFLFFLHLSSLHDWCPLTVSVHALQDMPEVFVIWLGFDNFLEGSACCEYVDIALLCSVLAARVIKVLISWEWHFRECRTAPQSCDKVTGRAAI